MNLPGPHSPSAGDPSERRRERRLRFSRRCSMTVKAPAWAMGKKALSGTTDNITLNGIKISGLKTEPGQAHTWKRAIESDTPLEAEVILPELEGFPHLRGQIVWIHTADEDDGGNRDPLICSVGIFFSILKESESRAIRDLIKKLSEMEGE